MTATELAEKLDKHLVDLRFIPETKLWQARGNSFVSNAPDWGYLAVSDTIEGALHDLCVALKI